MNPAVGCKRSRRGERRAASRRRIAGQNWKRAAIYRTIAQSARPSTRPVMIDPPALSGNLFLFERPELLSKEEHGHLGLLTTTPPFAFARKVSAVPLMVSEFRSAQRYYPIVFTERDDPTPLAVLGVPEERNLFIDDEGRWQVPGYIPAYLRCYPFALATAATDRYALVFDRSAEMISERPDVPFFDGDALSETVQKRLELCRTYQAEKQRTDAFCDTLKRLDLLVPQEASRSIDGQSEPIAQYFGVHRDRLMNLDEGTIATLLRDGSLGAIVAHLFSLDNFDELLRLRDRTIPR